MDIRTDGVCKLIPKCLGNLLQPEKEQIAVYHTRIGLRESEKYGDKFGNATAKKKKEYQKELFIKHVDHFENLRVNGKEVKNGHDFYEFDTPVSLFVEIIHAIQGETADQQEDEEKLLGNSKGQSHSSTTQSS